MKTVNILRDLNLNIVDNYFEVLTPDYIFIPIVDENYIIIKLNTHILKGQLVYDDNNIKRYSSVSGIALKIGKLNNKKYLIIKNDYKELSISKRARNVDNISKEVFLKYYSNDDIKKILDNKIHTLYINAIDDDPYIYNKYMYLKNNIKDISDIINNLLRLFAIERVEFVIKDSYRDLLNDYKININYNIVNDIYPIGNDKLLRKYLINRDDDFLINIEDILDMVYEVKKNKPILEKYVTINGNLIDNPSVINVKKYTYLKEILSKFNIKEKNYSIILNNSLCGKNISLNDCIITSDINGVIINKNNNNVKMECTRCGLCYDVCPVNINPLIKSEKCIKCGLCNYVCPSKIDVVKEYQDD
ncbi:MAG: 4Fe-4S binding protein [Bacilli bacterium]|nr:4Fe-4S binding protein [Bacilli bacterium]